MTTGARHAARLRRACGCAWSAGLLLGFPPAAAAAPDAAADSTTYLVAAGDTLVVLRPLLVLGSRVPAALPGAVRQVGILAEDDLRSLPGRSPAEFLQTQPGVATAQRQQYGVQSDLSIRGSTFEQVQVLLDGYDVGDPQTGHHLLDLPLGSHDVARLEVMPGHGSALYGSGAFGGTVNVVPKDPLREAAPAARTGGGPWAAAGEAAALGGSDGTWGVRGEAAAAVAGRTGVRLSGAFLRTDGYDVPAADGSTRPAANDAETWSATMRLVRLGAGRGQGSGWDAFAGASSRDFGAQDFYAPYPSRERTRTQFASLRWNGPLGGRVTIEPRLYGRRHTDLFVLRGDDPQAYTNDHRTRRAGAELRGIVDLGRGHALALSVDGVYEDLDSRGLRGGLWQDALGSRLRRRTGAALELDGRSGPLLWQLGGRADGRDGSLPRYSGSAAASAALTGGLSARASLGSVFRLPTFTELYYVDPSNRGNPDLRPEKGWTWDAGAAWSVARWDLGAAYFERYERDLIEWARPAGADPLTVPWQVLNVAEGTVRGTETQAAWAHPRGHQLTAAWTWLQKQTRLPAGFAGKYALLAPRQILAGRGRLVLPRGLDLSLLARWLLRTGGPDGFKEAFVLDGRLGWQGRGGWRVDLTATNLLERSYQEVPGVAMPGRLATVQVARRF